MAWKVKNESVNPANGQRMQRGQFLDPIPDQEHLGRLVKANAIAEAPDAEYEQWKRDEADRQTREQEDAQRRRQQQPNRSTEDRLADLERQVAAMRPPAPAPAIPRGGPGQTTPQQEAAAENEIKRRAGQRPGDDNDQSARKK
jgi:hypothetical protein